MTNFSLTGSLRTCKAKVSNDVRHYSSRVNGDNVLCTVPRNHDIVGRNTSVYGRDVENVENCSLPVFQDRMQIEQDQRPQYVQFISLNGSPFNNGRGNVRTGDNIKGHLEKRQSCGYSH